MCRLQKVASPGFPVSAQLGSPSSSPSFPLLIPQRQVREIPPPKTKFAQAKLAKAKFAKAKCVNAACAKARFAKDHFAKAKFAKAKCAIAKLAETELGKDKFC